VNAQRDIVVDVQFACDDPDSPDAEFISGWVRAAVAEAGVDVTGDIEVSVRVVDLDEIRSLNREYRDKDNATNVLSFPAGKIDGLPAEAVQTLGDVVVCAVVVREEAASQAKEIADHWAHMMVHGTLQLLGYDHMTDAEAMEMESLETRILATQGVADPYRSP